MMNIVILETRVVPAAVRNTEVQDAQNSSVNCFCMGVKRGVILLSGK
jgi:hypothetical protein